MQWYALICRTLALPNVLKLAESAKRKVREGSASSTASQGESRKRKRSALEEIRMVSSDLHVCVDTCMISNVCRKSKISFPFSLYDVHSFIK